MPPRFRIHGERTSDLFVAEGLLSIVDVDGVRRVQAHYGEQVFVLALDASIASFNGKRNNCTSQFAFSVFVSQQEGPASKLQL